MGRLKAGVGELFARYRLGIVLGAWLVTRGVMLHPFPSPPEAAAGFRWAGAWLDGGAMPPSVAFDQPPGAQLLVLLPRLAAGSLPDYRLLLAIEVLILDLLMLLLLARLAAAIQGQSGPDDPDRRRASTSTLLAYLGLTGLLGGAGLRVGELGHGLLLVAFVHQCLLGRRPWLADTWLALGLFTGAVPLVLLPLYLAYQGVARLPRVIALVAALLVPFTLWTGSLGVGFAARRWLPLDWPASATGRFMTVSSWAALAALAIALVHFVRALLRESDAAQRRLLFLRGVAAVLLLAVAARRTLHPEDLVWLAPFAAMLAAEMGDREGRSAGAVLLLYASSVVAFEFFGRGLVRGDLLPLLLLAARDGLIAWLVFRLIRPRELRLPPAVLAAAPLVAGGLFAVWYLMANLYEVTANDVFIHMRLGRDVLADWSVPQLDVYSAVAAGRPFIAHEWLSGVLFAGIDRAFGGIGLSIVQVLCPAAAVLLLHRSIPARARDHLVVLPLLGLCAYLIAFRVHVRPHLFSLVMVAAVVFAIEHWRRHRAIRRLWWLLPLQVIWVNLHGEFILGPILFAIVAGAVALLVLVPRLQGSAEPQPYTGKDLRGLAGLTAALLLVGLINPYGIRIYGFALEMWGGNDYIKKAIVEWQPTFLPANYRSYWFLVYCAVLVLLWLGLLVRARERPVVDVALALAVTVLSIGSQRFVAHLGLIGFPILVRSLGGLAELRRRPFLEIALAAYFCVYTAAYGYAYSPVSHRRVSWGYGGPMPYAEVAYLRASDLEGVVYNEYSDGALIIGELYPRIRPVMDSRIDIYGEALFEEYQQARSSPAAFHAYLARYRCTLVLLLHASGGHIYQALERDPDWGLALRTGERFLFVRATPWP